MRIYLFFCLFLSSLSVGAQGILPFNNPDLPVEERVEDALEKSERSMERESNEKIMAISEYSDTVLETMNKTHNEIMFLYSMLNDKQAETAQLVGDLQKLTKQIRDLDLESTITRLESAANHAIQVEKSFEPISAPVVEIIEEEPLVNETTNLKEFQDVPEDTPVLSKNEQILLLYKEGKDEVEIAKTLDCGLGEVRLVLGLYNNEA